MGHPIKNALFLVALVLVPAALGALIVGPQAPRGRNSRSATRTGHKAFYLLLQKLGYDVRRFERGLETFPGGDVALVALEPGPTLFRDDGRYAKKLDDWVRAGGVALITLGPDPDRAAELDDPELLFGAVAKRAAKAAKALEERLESEGPKGAPRAKRSPLEFLGDPEEPWPAHDLARFLNRTLDDRRLLRVDRSAPLGGTLAKALSPNAQISLTRPRVFSAAADLEVMLSAKEQPILLRLPAEKGWYWLLSEPRLLQNSALNRVGHAELGVRIIEALGRQRIYFEEFSHGGREAENIFALLLNTKAKWMVLQLSLLMLGWIFCVAPRRRSPVPAEPVSRRNKDEVIDAMASLYMRSGDVRGAAQRMIELNRRQLGNSALLVNDVGDPRAFVERAIKLRDLRSKIKEPR